MTGVVVGSSHLSMLSPSLSQPREPAAGAQVRRQILAVWPGSLPSEMTESLLLPELAGRSSSWAWHKFGLLQMPGDYVCFSENSDMGLLKCASC